MAYYARQLEVIWSNVYLIGKSIQTSGQILAEQRLLTQFSI